MKTKKRKTFIEAKKRKSISKPLTLEALASYDQKVLLPALDERFATKREFNDFENRSLNNQDAMLKKLDTLLAEKKIGEHQKEKEKKLLAIIIRSLKEHRILSSNELEEISKLGVF